MIGGGIYTLAGVILGVAGPFAWISLVLGSILALITVRSYFKLTRAIDQGGVPVTYLLRKGHRNLAGILSWWLIVVYVLAMGVYSFTFGHYLGRALGLPEALIALAIAAFFGHEQSRHSQERQKRNESDHGKRSPINRD